MTRRLLAEFATAAALEAGARSASSSGLRVCDALTPYPVPTLDELLPKSHIRLRGPMAVAGFGLAFAAFMLETWSTVWAYPFNSGDRPLFSWQVFILVPFEVGVLAAGLAGFFAFLAACGLPRLHHPIFDVADIDRVSQDRFFLLLDHPGEARVERATACLARAGAISVAEGPL